jgi:hypothetical protein
LDISGRKWRETVEDCIMRNLINVRSIKNYWDGQIMEGEIGGACSLHGMEEKCIELFGLKV